MSEGDLCCLSSLPYLSDEAWEAPMVTVTLSGPHSASLADGNMAHPIKHGVQLSWHSLAELVSTSRLHGMGTCSSMDGLSHMRKPGGAMGTHACATSENL